MDSLALQTNGTKEVVWAQCYIPLEFTEKESYVTVMGGTATDHRKYSLWRQHVREVMIFTVITETVIGNHHYSRDRTSLVQQ